MNHSFSEIPHARLHHGLGLMGTRPVFFNASAIVPWIDGTPGVDPPKLVMAVPGMNHINGAPGEAVFPR